MLAETPDRSAGLTAWSRDSKTIYLGETVGTSTHVIALPLDGSPARQVSTGAGVIRTVSLSSAADRLAFTYEKPETPVEVYTSSVNTFEAKQLTDVNQNVPKPVMGRTELVQWKSTGGFEIEGLLTYPVNYEAGKTYPLILNVHGGPAGAFTRSFTGNPAIYMIQTFAQKGYAVLRPNPRGSTGYGKEFRYANVKDWGFGDYDDLMAGVDKAIDMGVADPEKLFLMGWSYGGYMTSFMVTQTNRFKAASMGAGLPNLLSMVTTTDIQDYLAAHMGGEFWEDYETYEKHSAMYHIKNVTIPTQVIHGAQDLRVPFTQGQEFYRALGRLGVPTEMIVYPRTPHGPREPKFVMDVTPRILAWFEKYKDR
jgi:dipeptidyl aminopeptidase/acylaminoacyl peptidase